MDAVFLDIRLNGRGPALWILGLLLSVSGCAERPDHRWIEAEGYRWTALDVQGSDRPGFDMLSSTRTEITFSNSASGKLLAANRNLLNGSGVAVGDIDGDGLADIYFCSLEGDNRLYKNLGNWKFVDVTDSAGVAAPDRYATGAVFADVDGDTDLDLLVTALGGPNAAFENDGSGRFREVTAQWGLSSNRGSTTLALADVDGDGDLDLYVGNYKRIALRDTVPPDQMSWNEVVRQTGENSWEIAEEWRDHWELVTVGTKLIRLEKGEGDWFYLNSGDGHFVRESLDSGRFLDVDGEPYETEPQDWALEVQFHDINNDGHPDLYVCNDFESPDYIWLNDGTGHFRALGFDAMRKSSNSTMSVDFSDIDRDGDIDFFETDMLDPSHQLRQIQMATGVPLPTGIGGVNVRPQTMQNTLFVQREDGTFSEIGRYAGVRASGWSWSVNFMDVDLDGFEDALVSTGNVFDIQNSDAQNEMARRMRTVRSFAQFRELILDFPDLRQKNVLYRNAGDLTFEMVPEGWGFGSIEDITQGVAFGDFDNDGDLDIAANRLNAEAAIYRNRSNRHRVGVRLIGRAPNTQGIGARVSLLGGPVAQSKEVASGGMYVSGGQAQVMFAAIADSAMQLTVRWRNGSVSVIDSVFANRMYEVDEHFSRPVKENARVIAGTKSAQVGVPRQAAAPSISSNNRDSAFFRFSELPHTHKETEFDDFQIQPTLPRRLSRVGPSVVVADLDLDGDEDLILGGGSGSNTEVFRNEGSATFDPWHHIPAQDADHDFAGIVAAEIEPGVVHVFVAESGYENGTPSLIQHHIVQDGTWREAGVVVFGEPAIGPLCLADFDGDGTVELFAGARVIPGRYPEGGASRVYRITGDEIVPAPVWSAALEHAGMVSGAAAGDLDLDGDVDLVLAIEWGPIRVFENLGGGFEDRTSDWGLAEHTGWWNGVALGDLDANGALDIVATNWGWNSRYGIPEKSGAPLRLYWGDADGDGLNELVESRHESARDTYVPERGFMVIARSIPAIRNRISSFEEFAMMEVEQVLGGAGAHFEKLEATTLGHTLFTNVGDRFKAAALPLEAQMSTAMGVAVADLDLDGTEDLLLGQNFFGVPVHDARQDAGRGLWLKGVGSARFEPVQGSTSGIRVYGEQRGLGVGDLNGDDRPDLVITQNGASTKLLVGTRVIRGESLLLKGSDGNRWGIGATVRLKYTDGSLGPVRLVGVGDGYLSRHSSQVLLGIDSARIVEEVIVTWPDGTTESRPAVQLSEAGN